MTHTADLLDGSVTTPAHQVHQRGHALTGAISAVALGGLALMHFGVDGLISVLVPLQPVLASRTGARPALLGVVVAVALATASLLQPLAARLVRRFGERRVAVAGAFLAALGYGSVLAASDVLQAVAAVAIGGMGSSLFHPAAGALLARAAGAGREAVTLAAFSAVGTAGAAMLPTLPLPLRFVAMAIAGAGLSGSLPLLVSHARRPGESSAAGSVGRILGLAAGVGGAGYAGVGVLQCAVGYATALTGTVLVAGTAALAVAWFLCRSVDPQHCSDAIMIASSTCAAGCST